MKKITLASLLAVGASSLAYSQEEGIMANPDSAIVIADPIVKEPIVEAPLVDDSTVLSEEEKSLPDSLRRVKEFQLMRSFNPKDSLLEDKRLPEKRFITIGFTVGAGLSTYGVTGENIKDPGFGPAVQLGINCDLPFGQSQIGQYFSIQPELLFSFRETPFKQVLFVEDGGYDLEGEPTGEYEKFSSKDDLIYMSVPINVKASMRLYRTKKSASRNEETQKTKVSNGRIFLSVAPMVSLGLFGNQTLDGHNLLLFQSDPDEQREDPIYNNVDFSLYSRLGYDWDSGLTASLAFQLGFVDMVKASDAGSIKSRCLSINVGYNF